MDTKEFMQNLHETYQYSGEITWDEYRCNKNQCRKIIKVCNSDFKYGTLRITRPCSLILKEDIFFNPTDNCRSIDYESKEYMFGFFNCISIECSNVVIDLNGYCLQQNTRNYLLQRNFSLIKLRDGCKYCWITNGKLGLTSRCSIQGNLNENIYISDVKILKFEEYAINLNNSKNLVVKDCYINGSLDVPVTSSFTNAVIGCLLSKSNSPTGNNMKLKQCVDCVVDDISSVGYINPERKSTRCYINGERVLDRSKYAILINNSCNITLMNIKISNCRVFSNKLEDIESAGIKLNHVLEVGIKNVSICDIYNSSSVMQKTKLSESSPLLNSSYGIQINCCKEVRICEANIKCVHSNYGSSYGIYFNGKCKDVSICCSKLDCISTSFQPMLYSKCNVVSIAIGIYTGKHCSNICLSKNKIKRILTTSAEHISPLYLTESNM